jgi:hypothetical protein
MRPAAFTWKWLDIPTAFDKYLGRWTNVWINMVLFAMFAPVAFFLDHGWPRDLWWCVAGAQLGYAFMWLTHPRFTKARQREMEAQIAIIFAGTLHRITREATGISVSLNPPDEPDQRGTLQ